MTTVSYLKLLAISLALLLAPVGAWAQVAVGQADITVTGSATLISASSGTRVALSCTNTSDLVSVRWGDDTITATKGQRVPPGATIEILSKSAIYMISEGANVTVACTVERF